jgi:hypothetical protein
VGSSTQSGNRPDFIAAEVAPVVDFAAVGGKILNDLVSLIVSQLERLTAGSEHEKDLFNSAGS